MKALVYCALKEPTPKGLPYHQDLFSEGNDFIKNIGENYVVTGYDEAENKRNFMNGGVAALNDYLQLAFTDNFNDWDR